MCRKPVWDGGARYAGRNRMQNSKKGMYRERYMLFLHKQGSFIIKWKVYLTFLHECIIVMVWKAYFPFEGNGADEESDRGA